MKYLVVLADGMADLPIDSLGGKTPLAFAKTPEMDALAPLSEVGTAHTIPAGMKPGKQIGYILESALMAVLEEPSLNDRDLLMMYALQMM